MLVASTTGIVRDTLSESFVLDERDGYFYPVEQSAETPALARIYVAAGSYCIERRRNAESPWMPLVTADVVEFDPTAFRAWRGNWPVVQS